MSELMNRELSAPPGTRRALREVDKQRRVELAVERGRGDVAMTRVQEILRVGTLATAASGLLNKVADHAASFVPEMRDGPDMVAAAFNMGLINVGTELSR